MAHLFVPWMAFLGRIRPAGLMANLSPGSQSKRGNGLAAVPDMVSGSSKYACGVV